MTIFTFVLGFLLVAAGAAGLVASFDLLPTEIGLLYAVCGTLALSAGVVTMAIGALIRRLDVFTAAVRSSRNSDSRRSSPAAAAAPEKAVAPRESEPRGGEETREPAAAAEPAAIEAAPTLVGRYSAGGANYKIFSDGSIEAETENGAFKFASMSDFKAYLAGARG
jgi:hypothetical protein